MGSHYEFTCDRCGYRAEVSGGKDCGMVAVVETMVCPTCRELVDVLIGECGREGPTGDPNFDKDLGVCPRCRGRDVSAWKAPWPCPRCDGRMVEEGPTALWD